jgi:hypothetical protein
LNEQGEVSLDQVMKGEAVLSYQSSLAEKSLHIAHAGQGDKSCGLALSVADEGVAVVLKRRDRNAITIGSTADGKSFIQLGEDKKHMYMQATRAGDIGIEFWNRILRLSLQSAQGGTGLAVNRSDESSALRVGIDKVGDVMRNLWTSKGDPVLWAMPLTLSGSGA